MTFPQTGEVEIDEKCEPESRGHLHFKHESWVISDILILLSPLFFGHGVLGTINFMKSLAFSFFFCFK